MILGLLVIVLLMGCFMIWERLYPATPLPTVRHWWTRVLFINAFQLAAVIVGWLTWEKILCGASVIKLGHFVNPLLGGWIAYVINTWIFYFWHYQRHEILWLWLLCHQIHHSPQRLEAITSFYKHPAEIVIDSFFMSLLLYPLLGLTVQSSIWLSLFSAVGEMVYHCNVQTPTWMGYIFQRPESHRIHHMSNRRLHCKNFSDLPLWDILNDTFENPDRNAAFVRTGFDTKHEQKLRDMLFFRDVLNPQSTNHVEWRLVFTRILSALLTGLGCLQSIGFIMQNKFLTRVGYATVASPLPLVFSSYQGVETFATRINLSLITSEGPIMLDLSTLYHSIQGSYNRRNVYQVLFTHGPFFIDAGSIHLRKQVFQYILCTNRIFDILHLVGGSLCFHNTTQQHTIIKGLQIQITTQTNGLAHWLWNETIWCENAQRRQAG